MNWTVSIQNWPISTDPSAFRVSIFKCFSGAPSIVLLVKHTYHLNTHEVPDKMFKTCAMSQWRETEHWHTACTGGVYKSSVHRGRSSCQKICMNKSAPLACKGRGLPIGLVNLVEQRKRLLHWWLSCVWMERWPKWLQLCQHHCCPAKKKKKVPWSHNNRLCTTSGFPSLHSYGSTAALK